MISTDLRVRLHASTTNERCVLWLDVSLSLSYHPSTGYTGALLHGCTHRQRSALRRQLCACSSLGSHPLLIPVLLILILCLLRLRSNFFKSYVLIRKSFQLFFFMFLVGGLAFYVKADFRLNHFLLCAVPAAIFFAYYFLYAGKRWFYETLFVLLLAGIIFFQVNTF